MPRVHPFKSSNDFGIFDDVTNTAVIPLVIVDGVINTETFCFNGKSKIADMDHKLGEMIHSMNRKEDITKKSDGENIILDCSKIFKNKPFNVVEGIRDFNGIVKLNFRTGKIDFFGKLENPQTFTWRPKSTDGFEFRKDGRHPQSSHKIFSEVFQRSGFMFSEVFSHQSNMNLVVENMSEGLIGNLVMNTFIGEKGKKSHRGIKMVQDSSTYIWPYLWADKDVFKFTMGTDYKYRSIQYVNNTMKQWSNQFDEKINYPVILNISRGRGKNHTEDVTISVTHEWLELTSEE
jgi:hypothetical protein